MKSFIGVALLIMLVSSSFGCNKIKALLGSASSKPISSAQCDKLLKHEAAVLSGNHGVAAKQAAYVTLVKSETQHGWCKIIEQPEYNCKMKATTKAAFDACEK